MWLAQEKRGTRAGEQVCFREELKSLVGAQDKLAREKTAHLEQQRQRNGQPSSLWYLL